VNYTAENSLLTALFQDDPTGGTWTDQAATLLDVDDFQEEGCRVVFRAAVSLREQGLPVEMSAAVSELLKEGHGERALPWLVDATNGCPLLYGDTVARYAGRIKETSRARQLRSRIGLAGERIEAGESISQIKNQLVAEIEQIESEKHLSQDRHIGDLVMPTMSAIADRLSGDESKLGMRTGISGLDEATGGMKPGELWIVGAMPGRGKTSIALQSAMNIANNGFGVFFVSMEMSASAIIRRLMKMKFGAYVAENPSTEQWSKLLEYAAELKMIPLFLNESAALEASEIAQHSRVMIARNKIRLIIVDYLQIVRGPGRDRRERTGDAANVLRSLAKDSGVPVLALSQLRRPDNLNDRPSMIELKESGDLESHAHVVLLIHMPINEDGTFTGEEEIIIGKQREGPIGAIPVYFDRNKVLFRERIKP